jgi:hypothetical protein
MGNFTDIESSFRAISLRHAMPEKSYVAFGERPHLPSALFPEEKQSVIVIPEDKDVNECNV